MSIKRSSMSLRGYLRSKTGSGESNFIAKKVNIIILSFQISFLNQRSGMLLREQTKSSTSIFNFQLRKNQFYKRLRPKDCTVYCDAVHRNQF